MKDFRCYQLALCLYRKLMEIRPPRHLKDQLERAAASICLNLAEGYGRRSFQDKRRFYQTSLGSLREVQSILDLLSANENAQLRQLAHELGGGLYRLCQWTP